MDRHRPLGAAATMTQQGQCPVAGRAPGPQCIPHAQNKPKDLQLPSSHGLFGVTRRLDMMILLSRCKRIVAPGARLPRSHSSTGAGNTVGPCGYM
ncbi:hypothetical protein EYF80_046324 [Liparis tanakae]|uniref:Uncharacterized protein n=1 Tax=Liparis tanakae TaxID=230148 RepID=A0A4Z2FSY0_9TELE|nr:hypothetical protein EYF80_046324 [Liparis tanakae]